MVLQILGVICLKLLYGFRLVFWAGQSPLQPKPGSGHVYFCRSSTPVLGRFSLEAKKNVKFVNINKQTMIISSDSLDTPTVMPQNTTYYSIATTAYDYHHY